MTFLDHTEPYPWPWDGELDPAGCALGGGGSADRVRARRSPHAAAVAEVIGEVAAALGACGGSTVALRHLGPPSGGRGPRPALPPPAGHPDAEVLGSIAALADLVVDATGVDGFHGSGLDDELRRRRVRNVVLCGFGAEATVDSTLRSANDRGYECLTLTDACAAFAAHTGRHALCSITMSGGIFGAIGPSTALLDVLHPLNCIKETP